MRIYGSNKLIKKKNKKKKEKGRKKKDKKKQKGPKLPTKSKQYSVQIDEYKEMKDGKLETIKVIKSVDYDHWKKHNGISPNGLKFKKSSLKRKRDLGI